MGSLISSKPYSYYQNCKVLKYSPLATATNKGNIPSAVIEKFRSSVVKPPSFSNF